MRAQDQEQAPPEPGPWAWRECHSAPHQLRSHLHRDRASVVQQTSTATLSTTNASGKTATLAATCTNDRERPRRQEIAAGPGVLHAARDYFGSQVDRSASITIRRRSVRVILASGMPLAGLTEPRGEKAPRRCPGGEGRRPQS